jgi:D-inositol-3-phosphate glycosyltransferase
VRDLTRELVRRGIAVDVFTRSQNPHLPHVMHRLGPLGRVIHIPTGPEEPYDKNKVFDYLPEFVDNVRQFACDEGVQYDVIHSHYWLSGLAGNHLKDLWQVPHITMFHTLGALKNNSFPGSIEPASRIFHESEILQSCDRIIASTPAEKLEMVNRYAAAADRISVIPCGIDLSLFHPVHRQTARAICGLPERKTLLFVGRPDPIKGLENLLSAAPMLGHDSDFQLLVIGCGNQYMGDWRQDAGNTGGNDIKARTIYAGPVEHAKMYFYYSAADLCVIPSYYESFCMTALESVACGTPVLATAVGEIPEISRLSSLCNTIPDNNPERLARHIGILLQADGQAGHCTEPVLSRHYGWDSISRRIILEYEDIVGEHADTCKAVASG